MTSDLPIDSQNGRWPDEQPAANYLPPHSLEAEQAVLGGLMIANKAWDRISDLVNAQDFYRHEHRLIFAAIAALADKGDPFDAVTLMEHMAQRGQLDQAGGMAYLIELAKNTPSAANIKAYSGIIRERATLRHLVESSHETIDQAMNPEGKSAAEILDAAGSRLNEIGQHRGQAGASVDGLQAAEELVDWIQHRFENPDDDNGLTTGFADLDAKFNGGMQPADLVIVAGRPSMGKTTFAMNLVENAVRATTGNVLVYSLEMPRKAIMQRMAASLGRLELNKVLNPTPATMGDEDWPKLTAAVAQLKSFGPRFHIDDTAGISPAEMRIRTRRLAREKGPVSLIMVDYLQLMRVPGMGNGENRTAEISEISRSLKALAKEFNCPVIALSQLNRSLESRPNKRPVNADLRESGAIEQDADVIMFVYRDEVYHPETEYKGVAEIIIGKQRQGEIGTTRLAFLGKFTRFENLAPGAYQFDDDDTPPAPRGGGLKDRYQGGQGGRS